MFCNEENVHFFNFNTDSSEEPDEKSHDAAFP